MKIDEITNQNNLQHSYAKSSIEQITRIMELYMLAVQILESASDPRFKYFGQKIQHLMMKKAIVEQLYTATGKIIDKKTLEEVNKVEMQVKKQQHQMQIYFHQQQVDIKKIQQILKKSDLQVMNVEGRIKNHLTSQQKTLQQRIKSRKKRSQAGSLTKFKLSGTKSNQNGFNIKEIKQKQSRIKERDVRLQYFVDCNDKQKFDESIRTPPKKKTLLGSGQKPPLPSSYQNRFLSPVNKGK